MVRHGSHPAMSPPPGAHGTECPPKGSEVSPSPPTTTLAGCGMCTGVAASTPGHRQAASPTGTSWESLTFPVPASLPAVATIALLAAIHVLPPSRVQRWGTVTSAMFSLLPATPEKTAAAELHVKCSKAVVDVCSALAGPMPVMAMTTLLPARRPT